MTESPPPETPKDDEPMFGALNIVQRAALLGFMSPVFTIILVLKTMTLTQADIARAWYMWPDLYMSDLMLCVGISACSLGLLGVRRLKYWALPFIQIFYIFWMFFELVGYRFYFTTGSTLDWQLIVLYVSYIKQLWGMVSVVNETLSRTLIFGLIGLFLALPWFLIRRFASHREPEAPISRQRFALVGAAGLALSFLFPILSPEQRLGRNTIVEIGMSALEHMQQKEHARQHMKASRSDRTLALRPDTAPKNIVLIFLESTGAHVTGPYNQKAEAFTPTLTRLAGESIVMEQAHAIVPHTSKALFAVNCGMSPNPTAALTEAGSRGLSSPCMAELLAAQKYDTAFFQGATMFFEDRYSLLQNMGYSYMYGREELEAHHTPYKRLNYFGYESKALLKPARSWLAARPQADAPFLLTFLTLAPHHDYKIPPGFPVRQLHENTDFNNYLNCVAYVDSFVDDVITMLREQGKLDDTIVAIIGDHGEGFGEHGRYYHDNVIHEEALRIPFLIRDPSAPQGKRIKPLSSQLDALPTLLSLAGFELKGTFDGKDLLDEATFTSPRQLTSYCWYERTCSAHFEWPYKLVHHFGQRPEELYDLEADPKEEENLLGEGATLPQGVDVDGMRARLLRMLAQTQGAHSPHASE